MPASSSSSVSPAEALRRWRFFATNLYVTWSGRRRSWAEHISGAGYGDEQQLVQRVAFPAFANELLGFESGADLAAEESSAGGKPDFTPADALTHPFVFETKSTRDGFELKNFDEQVRRYLTEGRPRIRRVLLTNLVGARIFELDNRDRLVEVYAVNLRFLLTGPESDISKSADAQRLARMLEEFSHKTLSRTEKLVQVRNAPEWNPLGEVTSGEWISGRLDRAVRILTDDVESRVAKGALTDRHTASAEEQQSLLYEMRLIATRLSVEDADKVTLEAFLQAADNSDVGKARRQYCSHVAYYAATRLTLVRIWEDLGLLEPMLHDGGFDRQMNRFDNAINYVIDFSFQRARDRYRSLFDQRNGYTWYTPSEDAYIDVIYQLANTYLGRIRSDVLGQVYERTLERIDRKLLGQYYTPRDIIALIWDLIDLPSVAEVAEADGRQPRILDIATGSGGFLVEATSRLRERFVDAQRAGASLSPQEWLDQISDSVNGIEIQRFSAYLAELNLLVQLAQVAAADESLRIPPLGVLSADTLSLHEPDQLSGPWENLVLPNDLLVDSEERRQRAQRVKAAEDSDFLMDIVCGNPPYVGEKSAAPLTRRARSHYPYWEQFVAQHMDYLYWFLILGVSKLRQGGRFGFITTEYWLRAEGAAPLRRYLAERCHVERILLFRDFRLFPDAPGQHSLIVIGTRAAAPDQIINRDTVRLYKPRVSIYEGRTVDTHARQAVLSAMRDARSGVVRDVRTFTAPVSPNSLGKSSWADVILTQEQFTRRRRLREVAQFPLIVSKGVETTVNSLTSESETLLTQRNLEAIGGTGSRAGIQLLTNSEVARLGVLTDNERSVIRRVVNTRDVYPYATILPEDAPSIIYLPKPEGLDPDLSDDTVISSTPFPPDLPHIEEQLRKFRAVLEEKTRSRNERRPWWSLHRARANVVGDASADATGWGRYCLTSRWGNGGRLVVGMAPAGTSPASGLHVLRPGRTDVSPAYLSALLNSTIYQDVAETLPPGQLRQSDLERLGLPDVADYAEAVIQSSLRLAAIVTSFVTAHARHWPLLADAVRSDVALSSVVDNAWSPNPGPSASWGTLATLGWIGGIERRRAGATRLGDVYVEDDLFGVNVVAAVNGRRDPALVVHVADGQRDGANILAARLRGLSAMRGCVRDIDGVQLPIRLADLVSLFEQHRLSLNKEIGRYHAERAAIDEILDRALK